MSEDSIKRGIVIVNQFFECMEKLNSEVSYFKDECTTAIIQKEAFFKVYGLSYNLAWTLRRVICRIEEYGEVLRNTLLYDYWEKNDQYVKDVTYLAKGLEEFIAQSLEPYSMELLDDNYVEIDLGDDDEAAKVQIGDNEYLENISKDLSSNCGKIYRMILFYIRYVLKQLIDIRNMRLNRTESDYTRLFDREFKEYLTTDAWNELRDSFIDTTVSIKYRGNDPSVDQLLQMRDNEFGLMMVLRKELGSFDAYLSDTAKLAKHLVNKEIKHDVKNPVLELFSCLGRMKLIDQWISEIQKEAPLMEHYEGSKPSETITFTERMSESRLKSLWPKIEEVYKERKAIDLVCLYHVLVLRKCIVCDDFKFFARWINETAGKKIISEGNIRQIKMSYWAKEADHIWTIDGLHKYRDSAKADSQYRDYELLCDRINELIK
jgi:hypothetical protein